MIDFHPFRKPYDVLGITVEIRGDELRFGDRISRHIPRTRPDTHDDLSGCTDLLPVACNCCSFYRFSFWFMAARYCHDQDKVLALTESDDDQTFYAGYIQGALSASQALSQGITGVWTSVRSVPNGTEPVWVSFPGSYVLSRHYWQPGEPNIYPNYEDVCVSLQQETMFRNWMSESCDAHNYVEGYVCSQNMPPFTQTCSNPNSLKTISNKCAGLSYCSIRSLKELFPETSCPVADELFLQYRFQCSEDRQAKCSSGSFYITGRCLVIEPKQKRLPFDAAREDCRRKGGYLASNIDESMDMELSRQVVRKSKDNDVFWIDLQVNVSGQALWSDGSVVTYRLYL
ncbi:unnamed protein product [Heligmosomoides polygyrus]|uniref:C-type lectin domain-containing protein n=1 Tax=Heligmosomoides polygyrus TaxID=6339 RepID=A0A3P8BHV0_HELPZ|nr:unnamed protein product [Heligmosomoides polygyrus]